MADTNTDLNGAILMLLEQAAAANPHLRNASSQDICRAFLTVLYWGVPADNAASVLDILLGIFPANPLFREPSGPWGMLCDLREGKSVTRYL